MRIDLHVHSRFSKKPSQWILKKLGCPESFTEPARIYERCRAQGMGLVTITDHNVIDGCLDIAHLPGTFVSEEVTALFPEDRCKVHVLALDITEAQHREIQRLRENVYELAPYLRRENILHVLAHPLYSVNDRLTLTHFEKLLLLFKNFECNGTRDGYQNDTLKGILAALTPEVMDRLANRHGLEPGFAEPWRKNLTGGSDDHSGQGIGSMCTEVAGAANLVEFKRGLLEGRAEPRGRYSNPKTMSLILYSLAYQFYKGRFGLGRYVNKDIFLRFVDRFLAGEHPREAGVIDRVQAFFSTRKYLRGASEHGTVQQVVRFEAARLICDDKRLTALAKGAPMTAAEAEHEWFRFLTRASNRVLTIFADNLLGHVSGANIFDVFQTVGSAGALYSVLAPYFVSYGLFKRDRTLCDQAALHFGSRPARREPRVGHFTDTFFEINGVAKTLRRSVAVARSHGKDLTVVTCCRTEGDAGPGVRNFIPVGTYVAPEYPELKMYYPPVLEMLDYAYHEGFTHLHAATPGPIGLAALLIARMLELPLYGTYHTQIPQYVGKLTDDSGMEDLAWKYMLWFYNQCDLVYAPSWATAQELLDRGLPEHKIRVYPRGVDTERFHPARRNGYLKRYTSREGLTFLYVGRISKEKNLDVLAEAFRRLSAKHPGATLVLTGDGPYKRELEQRLRGLPAIFTGYVEGEELAALYASCDVFVFPSRTDTFGNVVLEAQASGLPSIVADEGGPQENVVHGKTGFVVNAATPDGFVEAMDLLAREPNTLGNMGTKARAAMEERTFERAFVAAWEMQYGRDVA